MPIGFGTLIHTEFRSCVKVEVAVLCFNNSVLMNLTVSVDVKQH